MTFNAWVEEFVAARRLGDEVLTILVFADAYHAGPMGSFFTMV